ncbi:alpha/beta hydrolase [Piscinibacterium candidicorallinum]|uniref:Alpha/beta hydrolase n=1 Tax=Piscinibacterium candidicorallinum TaxID=1793872 RepID=A0ABV7H9T2_9BURK
MSSTQDLPLALRLSVQGIRSVGHLDRELAARWAMQLFCTPMPPKWAVNTRLARAPWPSAMQRGDLAFQGRRLRTYRLPAADSAAPRVLLTHGWAGAARQFVKMAGALHQAGFEVHALDHVAHGRSTGLSTHLPQFMQALDYMGQVHGPFDLVIGHSMGAGAAAMALTRGLQARGFVSIASPTSLQTVLREFARGVHLPEALLAPMQAALEARAGMRLASLEAAHNAQRLNLPTLLVHDLEDRVVRPENLERLKALIPHAELLTTRGHGHNRILAADEVIDAVRGFAGQLGLVPARAGA